MLFGKKGKILAFILSFILSISIQLTGNFGIFNILTINLSIWLLTDSEIRFKRLGIIKMNVKPNIKTNKFIKLLIINILMLNIFYLYKIMFNTSTQKNPLNFLNYELAFTESNSHSVVNSYIKLFSNFKIVSPHGVFKYIPNERKTLKAFKRDSGSFESISLSPNRQQNTIFYFEAPYMDRINYYCFYQSLGSVFWDYYNLNDLKYYMPSFGESLLKFHFNAINKANENGELNELILINTTFNIDEKIEVLKIDTILFKTTNDIENFTKNFSYYKYHVQ
jgi:hypothetical protein